MKRRIVISIVAAVMLAGGAYSAATAGGPGFGGGKGDRGGMHIARMAEMLGLSDAQKEQVKTILKAEQDKTEPLRQQLFESQDKIRQLTFSEKFDEKAVRAIASKQAQIRTDLIVSHARARSEIHALLTPEQRAKAETMGPKGGPRHGRMQQSEELD